MPHSLRFPKLIAVFFALVLSLSFTLSHAKKIAVNSDKADAVTMNPMVKLTTNMGVITVELDQAKAPVTVANFIAYTKAGFYNGTIFHRVIDGFMIQGGGFTVGMNQKATRGDIKNEANNGLKNTPYTIAMARRQEPHSANAQFFINVNDNAALNFSEATAQGYGYCVFGRVIKGKEVVDQIRKVKTGNNGMFQDVPVADVIILKAELVSK